MESERFNNHNKTILARRVLLAVLLLITFLLQNTAGLFPRPWGVPAMLLVPAVVCVAMFEREIWGMLSGLFAGVLLDAFSADTIWYHSAALTLTGFLAGLLITRLLRNNLKTCLLLSFAALLLYNTGYFVFCIWKTANDAAWYIYSNIYLASVIYTGLLTPLFYWIVRAIFIKRKVE